MPVSALETDWAWLAGLVDGEGSITTSADRTGVLGIRLAVGLTDIGPVVACKEITGLGSITVFSLRDDRHADRYTWRIAGKDVKFVLKRVEPYLRLKRPQALLVADWPLGKSGGRGSYKTPCRDKRRRREIRAALKALNRKGPRDSSVDLPVPTVKETQLRLLAGA